MFFLVQPTTLVAAINLHNTAHTAPFHPQLHGVSNVGCGGAFHATCAPLATKLITQVAYNGIEPRMELARLISKNSPNARVLEIGCGVGTLTEHLVEKGLRVVAVDTSKEMLRVARRRVSKATFFLANGVDTTLPADVAVSSFVFHEAPVIAHRQLIRAMARSVRRSGGPVWIMDLHPERKKHLREVFYASEPFAHEYLETIDSTMSSIANDLKMSLSTFDVVDGHVRVWTLQSSFI